MRACTRTCQSQPRRWTAAFATLVAGALSFGLLQVRHAGLATTPASAAQLLGWQVALAVVTAGLALVAYLDLTAPRRLRRARRDAAIAHHVAIALAARYGADLFD